MGYKDKMESKGLCAFTYVVPGDRVFSTVEGVGVIHQARWNEAAIDVKFNNGKGGIYTYSGVRKQENYVDVARELFWDDDLVKKPMMPERVFQRGGIFASMPHLTGIGG